MIFLPGVCFFCPRGFFGDFDDVWVRCLITLDFGYFRLFRGCFRLFRGCFRPKKNKTNVGILSEYLKILIKRMFARDFCFRLRLIFGIRLKFKPFRRCRYSRIRHYSLKIDRRSSETLRRTTLSFLHLCRVLVSKIPR